LFENGERLLKRPTELGQTIEGGSVEATGVDLAGDETVALSSPERLGEHFVADSVDGVIEFLVPATPAC
jgi:hypothetical protein